MVSPCSDRITRVPPYSSLLLFEIRTGLSPTKAQFSNWFQLEKQKHWPGPRSLATTKGISVDFFSSGYLDVSVPRVSFATLWIQVAITTEVVGFPHSDISGSKLVCQLAEAFRRLPRPSSPLTA